MRLIEPFAVVDTFTSGLGRVEILKGGNMRLTYFADTTVDEDGRSERVVVAKVIIPVEAVAEGRTLVNQALLRKPEPQIIAIAAAH